jgi:hypothetical protein
MIVAQRIFRILDRAFDSLQLLRKLQAWFAGLDHFNDLLQVSVSALKAPDDRWMIDMGHDVSYPPGGMQHIPGGGYEIHT